MPGSAGLRALPPVWGPLSHRVCHHGGRGETCTTPLAVGSAGSPAADGEVTGISAPGRMWPQARGWLPVIAAPPPAQDRRPGFGAPPPRCRCVLWGCRTRGCSQRAGIAGPPSWDPPEASCVPPFPPSTPACGTEAPWLSCGYFSGYRWKGRGKGRTSTCHAGVPLLHSLTSTHLSSMIASGAHVGSS